MMNPATPDSQPDSIDPFDDPRVLQISREYCSLLESNQKPDRQEFLERFADLRDVIEECLDGIDLAYSMKKTSPHILQEASLDPTLSPQPLGDFRILREIGRGGMGVVYEAIQLSLGRHVALKVLPMAASLDERYVQRFKMEAQAAAQLHHNHIVPVYAVGCERGMHYYAMQLINGAPVSSQSFRGLHGNNTEVPPEKLMESRTALPTSTRNRDLTQGAATGKSKVSGNPHRARYRTISQLIANVADALDYAHSCGVVHRDVKPGNLMLDSRGKIWVTDFGLAMVAANNPLTQTGDFVGTLRYMSPEQASGQKGIVDHRSDIYALGATMYELLVDRPMMDAGDRPSLLHQILYTEPKPLRSVDKSIPVELETIVQKATQHNPADRYQSAEAFANDLRRFLDERPIQARKPSFIDRGRKWARRHPAVVASTMFAMLVSLIALGIITALVENQRSLTMLSLKRETDRSLQAEKRLSLAQQAADEMIRLAEDELSDNPFEEGLRMRLLSSALRYYQSFIDEQRENPQAQSDLRATSDRLSKILADMALIQADRDTMLLSIPEVRRDLKIHDQQETDVLLFISQYAERRQKWSFGARPTEAEILEQAKWSNSRLDDILHDQQRQRIKQLAIQFQGNMAFRDLNVSANLNLERAQKQQMQIEEDRYLAAQGFGGMPRGNGQRFRGPPRGPQYDPELMSALLAILNEQQREKWREMTGEPFDFSQLQNLDFVPFRPGGRPR
jgi:serine/threonine protein kinase